MLKCQHVHRPTGFAAWQSCNREAKWIIRDDEAFRATCGPHGASYLAQVWYARAYRAEPIPNALLCLDGHRLWRVPVDDGRVDWDGRRECEPDEYPEHAAWLSARKPRPSLSDD